MSAKAQPRRKRSRRTIQVLLCRGCGTEIGLSPMHDRLHADKGADLVEMEPDEVDLI
jgi:hypothetical protein